ncbi:MAG: hypothetical protein ACXVP0_05360 [Bacteroidia bacterium]
MSSIKERIERLKSFHYLASIFLFISTLCFCSYNAADLKLINISLSHYGISNKIGFFWNASLFVMGITLFVEVYLCVCKYNVARWIYYIFCFSIFCLLVTAVVTMTHRLHFYTAYAYFIGYTSGIFLFGYQQIKTDFRIGITSIIISITSVLMPVGLTLYLHSFAIPEITHTTLIFSWLLIARFDTKYKNSMKAVESALGSLQLFPFGEREFKEEVKPEPEISVPDKP